MECIFCKIVRGDVPCYKLAESQNFLSFLDIDPHSVGHALIIPKKHATNLLDLPEFLGNELLSFSQRLGVAILAATKSDGFTFILSNGKAANQTVFHTHFHIVPRKEHDGFGWDKHIPMTRGQLDALRVSIQEQFK
jgi:histidine triad (HIT) family protein